MISLFYIPLRHCQFITKEYPAQFLSTGQLILVASWPGRRAKWGDCPHPKFRAVGKLSKNLFVLGKCLTRMQTETPRFWGIFDQKNKILCNYNFLCRKFAASVAVAIFCLVYLLNPRRHWLFFSFKIYLPTALIKYGFIYYHSSI